MTADIYLSIGSNIADRAENIISALSFLQSTGFIEIKQISSFYETSPVGPKQRNFYNIVLKAQTGLNPKDLLAVIKQAEMILGRKPSKRWSARLIDIDILLYGNSTFHFPNSTLPLKIPHKELCNRLFVLIPLCEIAQNLKPPVFNRKIKQILDKALLTHKGQKVKIVQL